MEFKKNGNSIILNKKNSESDDIFLKKGWFIISQPDIHSNYNEIVRMSKIWENIKYRKCIYNSHIMNKIKIMEKNILTSCHYLA